MLLWGWSLNSHASILKREQFTSSLKIIKHPRIFIPCVRENEYFRMLNFKWNPQKTASWANFLEMHVSASCCGSLGKVNLQFLHSMNATLQEIYRRVTFHFTLTHVPQRYGPSKTQLWLVVLHLSFIQLVFNLLINSKLGSKCWTDVGDGTEADVASCS